MIGRGGWKGHGMVGHGMMGHGRHHGMMGRGMMCGPWLGMLRKELELTDDQIDKLRGIFLNGKKEWVRRRADLIVAKIEVLQALPESGADRKKVEDAVKVVGERWTDLRLAQTHALLDGLDVLSVEQRKKLRTLPFLMMGAWGCPTCGRGWGGMDSGGVGEGMDEEEEEAAEEGE